MRLPASIAVAVLAGGFLAACAFNAPRLQLRAEADIVLD